MITVSIVIVCMNNLKNLYPCLDSIKKHTQVTYETFVVAYLFSKENLEKVKKDYPWVIFIESNEIRGFSENNNLALKQAKGKYCFVVNDDTEIKMPCIDKLVDSFQSAPKETAIISPILLNASGSIQVCGRPKTDWKDFILDKIRLPRAKNSPYINKTGFFQTYNIIGAAFLIDREKFKEIGWFDEYYFFCPEDLAVSTDLNELGYKCYVDTDAEIIHYEGMSGKSLSMIRTATAPAGWKGGIHFCSKGNNLIYMLLLIFSLFFYIASFILHRIKGRIKEKPNTDYILSICDLHILKTLFTRKSPKEIFVKYYKKVQL